jgi:hypothetical protein
MITALAATDVLEDHNDNDNEQPMMNEQCRLWMAPSYLSRENMQRYGLYAGVDYEMDDILPNVEIGIPLIDFVIPPNRNRSPKASRIIDMIESHIWTGEYSAEAQFESNHSTAIFLPGMGSHSSYHTGIYNVQWYPPSSTVRDDTDTNSVLSWYEPTIPSPLRGAITPYHNFTMRATQRIVTGMELFANYGTNYDDHFGNAEPTEETDLYQNTITRWDYMKADEILQTIVSFLDQYHDHLVSPNDPTLEDDVLDFILEKILGGTAGKHAKVVRQLIPPHTKKIRKALAMGGTFHYRYPDMVRTIPWLRKHGVCVDKLRSGKSTIPNAGRGAFATRTISKGETIVPVPLMVIAFEEVLDMYTIVPDTSTLSTDDKKHHRKKWKYDYNLRQGKQLLYNYAYGHPESSVMLVPTGPMATLINHAPNVSRVDASTMSSTTLLANAELVWSNNPHMPNNDNLFDSTAEQLGMNEAPTLTMNIVALRDIAIGEEIFIDYGVDWEKAYDQYIKKFHEQFPMETSVWPLRYHDLKVKYQIPTTIPTPETVIEPYPIVAREDVVDTEDSPYPLGVTTGCFLITTEVNDGTNPESEETGYTLMKWVGPLSYDQFVGLNFYACEVIHRIDATSTGHYYNYTVLARPSRNDDKLQIEQVPHYAITLIPTPYTSDVHNYPHTFRHWINIPDDRFPMMWRNFRQ